MKPMILTLAALLILATATWMHLDQASLIRRLVSRQNELETNVSMLEAAVKKLEHDTSLRFIPVAH